MTGSWVRTPHGLLTTHFLRQFLENDLISPDADRSQTLAVVTATIASLTLFVSAVMSFTYLGPLMTPGLASVFSLDDKFLYLSLGMIATALVAATQWDALAIDARDAAILEPLPVPPATIRRAKLSAVALLGAAASVLVNLWPSVVFPPLLVYTFRNLSFLGLAGLVVAHALWTVAASVFGYFVIVALREVMMALLGGRWFARVSPWVQGALIVMLGGSLLLLPAASDRIAHRGFDGWRPLTPPMWFLGAYEMTAGHVIAGLPRAHMIPRQAGNDRVASALYRQRQPEFPALARRAALAIVVTVAVAALASLWNARRLPSLAAIPPPARRREWKRVRQTANRWLFGRAAARAGFHFALAAMWRSNTHRLTLACAAAVGFAMAVLALSNAGWQTGALSARLLAVQPVLYGALLVGFRHIIRVPAELRANWGFQLAWRGEERAFVAGVKGAAIVALVLPTLVTLLAFFSFVIGPRLALMHALLGLAGAVVLLEALMLNYDKVPFTCTYLPSENMKALAPIYTIGFVTGASMFARMERDALQGTATVEAILTLAVLFVAIRIASIRRSRLPYVQFDEAPATFQRLGLDA